LIILNLAIFGSGNGSNCKAIFKAIQEKKLAAEIKLIISDQENAGILQFAREHQIPGYWISSQCYPTKDLFYERLIDTLQKHHTDLIVLAGYLKKIGVPLISKFQNRIINIHPALLPSFGGKGMYGLRVHQSVIDSGVKVTGITVHLVDDQYDHGAIVLQRTTEVCDDDSPESLSAKVLKLEHEYYYQAIRRLTENKYEIRDRKIIFKN
jgi:phosphoribosylglycinamide formyltransferase-1